MDSIEKKKCLVDYEKCIWMNLENIVKYNDKSCTKFLKKCFKNNKVNSLPKESYGFKDD